MIIESPGWVGFNIYNYKMCRSLDKRAKVHINVLGKSTDIYTLVRYQVSICLISELMDLDKNT